MLSMKIDWCPLTESNRAPTDYESAALTKHELRGQSLVSDVGFELTTSCSQSRHSNQTELIRGFILTTFC